MPKVKIYTVDAFTDRLFRGNTCAVCVLPAWPVDELLQRIALQNGYSETAFIVLQDNGQPELRWFTVSQEVTFCGHGTISAGYVYMAHVAPNALEVIFKTRHYGLVKVRKNQDRFEIEVPVKRPLEEHFDDAVYAALGGPRPDVMVKSERGDLLVVYRAESDVRAVHPNFQALMACGYYGYVLTAPGDSAVYVYRYFSPRMPGVWEDPVNGASHSVLAPYWSARLDKTALHGQAVSARGGDVYCAYERGEQVKIAGQVMPYLEGELSLEL